MLRGFTLAAGAVLLAGLLTGATKKAPAKPTAKKVSSSTKKSSAKKTTKKRVVVAKPPVVSAKVKEASQEYVSGAMDAVAAAAIENSAALVPFYEQLWQMEQSKEKNLHVLQYGDSHTASDDWANQLRVLFQGRFGNGGAGYSIAGRPFAGYRRYDVKSGQSTRWETEGLLTKGSDGYYGLGGVSIAAQRAGETVYLDAEGQNVELSYLQQPGGGKFRVSIDGTETATISTDGPLGPGYWSMATPEGLKRFTVETLSHAPVRLLGWVTERNQGLTWETLGINGAQANLSLRWEENQLRELVAKRNPGLIVFAYGTNEASNRDWTPETYRAMFRGVLQRFRAMAPGASFLVVGPPDRAQRVNRAWVPVPKLDMISEAQRAVALEMGCAFWDLRERMGGSGAIQRWVYAGFAQGDFVHLTGAGYRLVGETLYKDLMAHYEEFRRIRQKVFGDSTGNNNDSKQN
ncbi:SGNH/GDSL hydrolase family protein [Bryobacter aggregatus]|uniref:SGNH/GDSL hydrolase family protein n=1 Tax=Bryobacter aggregatus TaxID=360054 RepID=UPI0004E18373|nr:SGNH/GDSL hydrolase family protein [Bryobacter aggregatus]